MFRCHVLFELYFLLFTACRMTLLFFDGILLLKSHVAAVLLQNIWSMVPGPLQCLQLPDQFLWNPWCLVFLHDNVYVVPFMIVV